MEEAVFVAHIISVISFCISVVSLFMAYGVGERARQDLAVMDRILTLVEKMMSLIEEDN
jgi:hypothetical protein